MNSTFRPTLSLAAANAGRAAALAALLLGTATAALAQGAALNIPGAASAPPPVVAAPPPAPAVVPTAELPASQQPAGMDANVAQMPQAPALPPLRSGPPAVQGPAAAPAAPFVPNRQVDQQLEKAQAEAVKRLNQLSPEGLASADPAAIGGELERMNAQQRKLRELELYNKQADLVQKLYKTMYGDEAKLGQPAPGAPGAQPKGVSEEEVKRRIEEAKREAVAQAEKERAEKEREELQLGPRPVVAQIIGTGRNRQAVVMLPCDRGSLTVRAGNRLTQGDEPMRVVSITDAGVEVSQKGNRFLLGFGNVSSKCTPNLGGGTRTAQQGGASVGSPVPVMGGPLQISGGARMR